MGGYRTIVVGTDGSQTSFRADRGPNTLAGRIVGPVPLGTVRHTPMDVLIVHTA